MKNRKVRYKQTEKLYNDCNGKMHVEIFKVLFNHEIRQHIITETIRYTKAQHNGNLFEIPEGDLKCYVGTLFLLDRSLQQFGFWHLDYSIVEQVIPYFGMHSAKQTVRNKSVRFGNKTSYLLVQMVILIY